MLIRLSILADVSVVQFAGERRVERLGLEDVGDIIGGTSQHLLVLPDAHGGSILTSVGDPGDIVAGNFRLTR